MSDRAEFQGIDVHILDLPEEIFRTIFSYLKSEDLHSNLRNTCQLTRNYVTNYVEWEQTCIMLFEGIYDDPPMEALEAIEAIEAMEAPMEAIHMIKFASNKPLFYTKTSLPEIPNQRGNARLVFAATIQKRIVIGINYVSLVSQTPVYGNLELLCLEKDEWVRICPSGENHFAYDETYDVSNDSKVIWSQIGESNIILFHTMDVKDNAFFELLHFHKAKVRDLLNGSLTYSSYCFNAPKEMRSLRILCLIERNESEVLVVSSLKAVGGTPTVWSGCLSQDKTDIIWKDTGHKIPFMGHYNPYNDRCFYVDKNIYFSYHNNWDHGDNYDRYNWEEKKYYRNVFSLSSLLNGYTGAKEDLIVAAASIDHLMKRVGRHVSVWSPVNRIYSKRQPLVFKRYEGLCGCKNKPMLIKYRDFDHQYNNEIGSEVNCIFLLSSLKSYTNCREKMKHGHINTSSPEI